MEIAAARRRRVFGVRSSRSENGQPRRAIACADDELFRLRVVYKRDGLFILSVTSRRVCTLPRANVTSRLFSPLRVVHVELRFCYVALLRLFYCERNQAATSRKI